MTLEKEMNVAKNKCAEMRYILDQRAKEREQENDQKRDLNNKLNQIQQTIMDEVYKKTT